MDGAIGRSKLQHLCIGDLLPDITRHVILMISLQHIYMSIPLWSNELSSSYITKQSLDIRIRMLVLETLLAMEIHSWDILF